MLTCVQGITAIVICEQFQLHIYCNVVIWSKWFDSGHQLICQDRGNIIAKYSGYDVYCEQCSTTHLLQCGDVVQMVRLWTPICEDRGNLIAKCSGHDGYCEQCPAAPVHLLQRAVQ